MVASNDTEQTTTITKTSRAKTRRVDEHTEEMAGKSCRQSLCASSEFAEKQKCNKRQRERERGKKKKVEENSKFCDLTKQLENISEK